MPESKCQPTQVWKEHEFKGKYQSVVPEGETNTSGPCLRNSLFEAGIYTDLPHWVQQADVKAICTDLDLGCFIAGDKVDLSPQGEYIIGYINDREKNLGHFIHTTNIIETLNDINVEDIFAIIVIPSH